MSEELIAKIYNTFNPYPLTLTEEDKALYVKCGEVRGDENIINQLGRRIVNSDTNTYQLYVGHRGAGKTTELYRLRNYLEKNGCFVVYFEADLDVDINDVQYTDILLACTRYILEELKDYSKPDNLLGWLRNRWNSLKDLALSEINIEKLSLDLQIPLFGKLTTTLKGVPSSRKIIRQQVDIHMSSLIDSLNQFIQEGKKNLPDGKTKIVVIADNLDRIPPTTLHGKDGVTNHDEIFIDRSTLLQQIDCHIVYTIPISLVHSSRANQIADVYFFEPEILPMIKVRERNGDRYDPGVNKLKEMITKRVYKFDLAVDLNLERDIFENSDILLRLCESTGGQVRELIRFVQTTLNWIDELPISTKSVQRILSQSRNTYRNSVDHKDWEKLVKVSQTKKIVNEQDYRDLLFIRCILEYAELTLDGEIEKWYDVHPLLQETEEFQQALEKFKNNVSTI
ncbi:MAG: ATP-binding protein [Cyanobacteria bacterium SBLK]|nr:ATP-binding protein [Cyanobacteria bacterium SBLK]